MTTRAPRPAAADDSEAAGAVDDATRPTDGEAVSPAVGPVPPVYVPRSPQVSITGLLWPAIVQAARRARAGVKE